MPMKHILKMSQFTGTKPARRGRPRSWEWFLTAVLFLVACGSSLHQDSIREGDAVSGAGAVGSPKKRHASPAAADAPHLKIDSVKKQVAIQVVYRPGQFNSGKGLQHHHFVVWEKGKAGGLALFNTLVSDPEIHAALVQVGAVPGNNLTLQTWDLRNDPEASDPDLRAEGTRIEMEIVSKDMRHGPGEFLSDSLGRPLAFRFSGNLDFVPAWQSGCVICLQGCPGGKIGHEHYTIRDLARGRARFRSLRPAAVSPGDTLTLILRPVADDDRRQP